MKTCTRCGESKTEDQFYLVKSGKMAGKRVAHCTPCDRDLWMVSKYGITRQQYEKILTDQGGGCAICGGEERTKTTSGTGQVRRLSVDHDHSCCPGVRSCGKCIRGILCNDCNNSIGRMKDDPARLRRAAEYLEQGNPPDPVH